MTTKRRTWVSEARRQAAFSDLLKNPNKSTIRWALACGISHATISQAVGVQILKDFLDNPANP